jgi:cytidyltransferase-like protein
MDRVLKEPAEATSKRAQYQWSVTNHGGQPMGLTDKQYAIFVGRFQPLHNGHIALFRQKLDAGTPLLIMVRDLQPDERNPFTTEQTVSMLEKVFANDDVKVMIIPDIESVNWGRGVGYELNEFVPPADLGAVSATAIRNGIKEGNEDWKTMVNPVIHGDIITYLKENNLISCGYEEVIIWNSINGE